MDVNKILKFWIFLILNLFLIGIINNFVLAGEISKKCLKCHSVKREPKVLVSGEKLSLYVNSEKFEKSVHGALDCTICHSEIDPQTHPKPIKIESKKKYVKRVSKNCLLCHPLKALSSVHKNIVKIEIPCSKCHGAHYVMPIREWKKTVKGEKYCMFCHKLNIKKRLASKEIVNLKVNLNIIKHSVHAKVKCTDCHYRFSKKRHYVYNLKSKKEYTVKFSQQICKKCHTEEKLKENPAHYELSKAAPCIKCHGYHNVQPIKAFAKVRGNKYCLVCHSKDIKKKMENGEILSLKVNEEVLLRSAHKKLTCIKCHKDFSKGHPVRKYKSIKEYRMYAQEICKNCHVKECKEYKQSIHAKLYFKGNPKAPDCLKCHEYHNVQKISKDKKAQLANCSACHTKEKLVYKESVHYKALEKGKTKTAVCSNCHNAHKVEPVAVANLNRNCLKCHKNVKKVHNKWLWNPPFRVISFVDVHFNNINCAVCHIKDKKAITLVLINKSTKEPLSIKEVAKALRVSVDEVLSKIDLNKNNLIEEKELWNFLNLIKQKVNLDLRAKMAVVNPNDAHKIEPKNKAIKDCTVCHNIKSDFITELGLKKDGKVQKIAVDKKAMNSINVVPNVRHFYVLGLTKIKIFDTLFVLGIIAALGIAFGHLGLRIITTPIRRKRRGGM